jgi:imidazolonepropionase-like amidohydrolase
VALLIRGATVIDGTADRPLEGHSIWLEGRRIKAIGRIDELAVPPSIPVVDARGKYVIPGLMDANVHLMGDIRFEQLVRHEGRYHELILESAQVALKSGLTTVFDTWGPRIPLMAVRDGINAGRAIGSRIFCAGNIIGLDGPFSLDFMPKALDIASGGLVQRINSLYVENVGPDLTWMPPEQVAEEVRAYLRTGIDFIKYASNEHRGGEPNAFLVFSPAVQSHIVAEAHRAGITAQAHTTSVEGLKVAIEAGADIIQHCNLTGPVPIPQGTLQMLAKGRAAAVVFPLTQRRAEIVNSRVDGMTRRFWSTSDINCRALISAGATLLLGTDQAMLAADIATDPSMQGNLVTVSEDNLFELGQGHFHWLKAMEEKGFPSMEILKAATRNIAVAYGKGRDFGTLEAGKIADLLILDENPLLAAKNYRAIRTIIKDGEIVNTQGLPSTQILSKPSDPPPETAKTYGRFAASRYPTCCGSF